MPSRTARGRDDAERLGLREADGPAIRALDGDRDVLAEPRIMDAGARGRAGVAERRLDVRRAARHHRGGAPCEYREIPTKSERMTPPRASETGKALVRPEVEPHPHRWSRGRAVDGKQVRPPNGRSSHRRRVGREPPRSFGESPANESLRSQPCPAKMRPELADRVGIVPGHQEAGRSA
jgi:hypothetical protein